MVAKHVDFDECVAAAVDSLSRGHPLTSFGCSKCGAVHLTLVTLLVSCTRATCVRSVDTVG